MNTSESWYQLFVGIDLVKCRYGIEPYKNLSEKKCFLGDLNLPNVNWINGMYPQSHEYTSICDAFYDCGFHYTVTSLTRHDNILDLVLVNDPLIVNKLTVTCSLGNSDHNKVEFELIAAIPARRTTMQSY